MTFAFKFGGVPGFTMIHMPFEGAWGAFIFHDFHGDVKSTLLPSTHPTIIMEVENEVARP